MKITHNKVGQNLNLTDTSKAGKTGKADEAKGKDLKSLLLDDKSENAANVDLSNRAQDMKKIKESALAGPDVDEAKIQRLQSLIDQGKYDVNAEDIADKMVNEHLMFS